MKVHSLILVLVSLLATTAFAMSELDAEVSDLQVHLRRSQVAHKKAAPKIRHVIKLSPRFSGPITVADAKALDADPTPVLAKKREVTPIVESSSAPVVQAEPAQAMTNDAGQLTSHAYRSTYKDPFFMRLTALGFATIGSFNGPDNNYVISRNVGNPYSGGMSGSLLADLNILGSRNFILEAGGEMISLGAYTGYDPSVMYSATPAFQDRVTLMYAGLPLSLKWMIGGEKASTAYIKVGATPNYLISSQYELYGNTSYASQDSYGGFNNFDVLVTGGVGFSLKLTRELHIVADIGYYQGMLPVSKYFNIYNTGFRVGGGIAYLL